MKVTNLNNTARKRVDIGGWALDPSTAYDLDIIPERVLTNSRRHHPQAHEIFALQPQAHPAPFGTFCRTQKWVWHRYFCQSAPHPSWIVFAAMVRAIDDIRGMATVWPERKCKLERRLFAHSKIHRRWYLDNGQQASFELQNTPSLTFGVQILWEPVCMLTHCKAEKDISVSRTDIKYFNQQSKRTETVSAHQFWHSTVGPGSSRSGNGFPRLAG